MQVKVDDIMYGRHLGYYPSVGSIQKIELNSIFRDHAEKLKLPKTLSLKKQKIQQQKTPQKLEQPILRAYTWGKETMQS